MIVGSVCACSGCRGVAVLTFLGMSRQLPVTTARHPASGATPNFCQSPLFFCAQRLDHFNQIIFATSVAGADIKVAILQQRDLGRVVGVEKFDISDAFITFDLQNGIEQAYQLAGVGFGTKDALEGKISARVEERHDVRVMLVGEDK